MSSDHTVFVVFWQALLPTCLILSTEWCYHDDSCAKVWGPNWIWGPVILPSFPES